MVFSLCIRRNHAPLAKTNRGSMRYLRPEFVWLGTLTKRISKALIGALQVKP